MTRRLAVRSTHPAEPPPAASARALAALDELAAAIVLLLPVRDVAGAVVDFEFAYSNRFAETAAGVKAGAFGDRTLLEALPSFPQELLAGLVTVLDGGAPLRTHVEYGDAFAGHAAFSSLFEVAASRLGEGLLVIYEDVAARSRWNDTERRFGAVLDATSDWVSIADGNEKLVYINPAGRRMVGIGADEDIVGLRVGEFSPEWARRRVLSEGLAGARRDGVWRGDLARRHRDGHEIPISQVIVASTTLDGEVEFYATIARDMTSERAAEAALRESEERFRIAFEQAPIGVSLLDLDGRYVQINDAYCRTMRRSREELLALGGPVALTHPDDVALTRHVLELLVAGDAPVVRFEKRYLDPYGETIWVEISASVFRDAEGRPQYLSGMLQDLGERRVAHTLQRSMLTTQLPDVEGVELAARYLPGSKDSEVGGDWYDVIPLPDGRVGVVIGDVVGRGIEAAATMSQLRTALRAYAIDGHPPAQVVARLHRLVDHLGVGLSTTLVYLDLDPATRELRYVSAGHLPVLHVREDGESSFLPGARSTPLGTAPPEATIPQERLVLEPGDTVLLYTDGLVERRDDGLDSRLQQLRDAVARAPATLHAVLEHLTTTLVAAGAQPDDIALLALRTQPAAGGSFSATIGDHAEDLVALRGDLRSWLSEAGASATESGDVLLAVGEACANALEHADRAAHGLIDVRLRLAGRELVASVHDRGRWRPATPRADRGHGLRLMRMLMDEVTITTGTDGTRVQLRTALADGHRPEALTAHRDVAPAPRAPQPAISVERIARVPVARLRGEIDIACVQHLRAALAIAVEPGDRGLVVDLAGVDYLDSAGVHLLHDLARTLRGRGQLLLVAVPPDGAVMRLFELVGLVQSLPIQPSVQAAVAALAPVAE